MSMIEKIRNVRFSVKFWLVLFILTNIAVIWKLNTGIYEFTLLRMTFDFILGPLVLIYQFRLFLKEYRGEIDSEK